MRYKSNIPVDARYFPRGGAPDEEEDAAAMNKPFVFSQRLIHAFYRCSATAVQ